MSCTECLCYSVVYTKTLDYDGNGNLSHLTQDIYNGNPMVQATNVLTFTWEAGPNHLTTLTKDLGGSLTTYTFQYDSLSRLTQFCSAPTTCSNFYYEGDSDWLSHVTDYYGTLISHYYYANGRPFAVDLRNMWGGYDRDYYRYTWHGDVSAVMDSNGNGDSWNNVSPFGDNGNGAYPANPNPEQYYGWGGAWGYLYFYGVFGGEEHGAQCGLVLHLCQQVPVMKRRGQGPSHRTFLEEKNTHLLSISWNILTPGYIYLVKEVRMKPSNSRLPGVILLALLCASVMVAAVPRPALALTQAADVPQVTALSDLSCTYIVRPGDTLFRIAVRYGISPFTLAAINGLRNINLIYTGMVLRVPCGGMPPPIPPPAPNICNIHIVQRGEWLNLIAARFGVSWQSIAAANRLANPSRLFPGQRLLIPCTSGTPARSITTNRPVSGQAICSPVLVSGAVTVSPFEATLRGRVYNDQGMVVGENPVHVNAQMGNPGTFSGQIPFDTTRVRAGTLGRVELADISPRDGSVLASSSVVVRFSCGQ